jgi:hypothetical protein
MQSVCHQVGAPFTAEPKHGIPGCALDVGRRDLRPRGGGRGELNENDQLWSDWLLGIFGTAGLFAMLAGVGMGAQGQMGWLAYTLGVVAFGVAPFFAVRIRPRRLTGGIVGLGMAIGALAILLIFASLYQVAIPPIAVVTALFLGFLGGALGETWLGTAV